MFVFLPRLSFIPYIIDRFVAASTFIGFFLNNKSYNHHDSLHDCKRIHNSKNQQVCSGPRFVQCSFWYIRRECNEIHVDCIRFIADDVV